MIARFLERLNMEQNSMTTNTNNFFHVLSFAWIALAGFQSNRLLLFSFKYPWRTEIRN